MTRILAPQMLPCTAAQRSYPRTPDPAMQVPPDEAIYPRYPSIMATERLNLHLVSDATGETLNSLARATVSQFENGSVI